MIPGELFPAEGEIELNAGKATATLTVANTGDRPIQVGSHFHFYEVNAALSFERDQARGMRLDIPAGTAVRFEPGDERTVTLVALAGERKVYGFNARVDYRDLVSSAVRRLRPGGWLLCCRNLRGDKKGRLRAEVEAGIRDAGRSPVDVPVSATHSPGPCTGLR